MFIIFFEFEMTMIDQTRLFVGNLPPDIQETELGKEFEYYGSVDKVEVKHKKSPDSDEIQNTFAFITIAIDEQKLSHCLRDFKEEKFRGRFLQVTVARENFLEKLKREREETEKQTSKNDGEHSKSTDAKVEKVELPTISAAVSSSSDSSSSDDSSSEDEKTKKLPLVKPKTNGNKFRKVVSSSSESDSESDPDRDNLVLKKKSKIFLANGKIKIDRTVSSGKAIHVIDKKANNKREKKNLDDKSKMADQKRIESIKKMKSSYNEQQLAIKRALAGVDTSKKSNKIVFGDDNEVVPVKPKAKKSPSSQNDESISKKPSLFNDDDENAKDYAKDFQIKEQFFGEKGQKLMKLQSRFQGDSRFKMDSKFLEDSDNELDEDVKKRKTASKRNETEGKEDETSEDDERRWQYNILESVMGKRVYHEQTKKKAHPSMLHFDPTRAEHTKFVEPKGKKRKTKNADESASKRSKASEFETYPDDVEVDEVPVSMEHFHEVRGDLKKSLGAGGFSLLSMFNRPADNETSEESKSSNEKPYEEKIITKSSGKFVSDFDPFKYDSSGDEAESSKNKTTAVTVLDKKEKDSGLQHESFFILSSTDPRHTEGLSLFTPSEGTTEEVNREGYDDTQRQELKNIVKRKIRKTIQNSLPKHAKPNKRFRRFAKKLL